MKNLFVGLTKLSYVNSGTKKSRRREDDGNTYRVIVDRRGYFAAHVFGYFIANVIKSLISFKPKVCMHMFDGSHARGS